MSVLKEYRMIQHEIMQLERQIDKLELLATVPRTSNLSGMPRSGRTTDGMDIVAKIVDMKEKYYAKLGRLLEIRDEAEDLLAQLGNEERVIIRYKYIDGMSNAKIAERINYSEATVKRRIKRAMKFMEANGEIHN